MKTASKVFLILGMVVYPIYALLLFFAKDVIIEILSQTNSYNEEALKGTLTIWAIIMLIYSIAAIVVGVLSIRKLNSATSKNELVLYGVLSLLFVNVIAGVLILCIPEDQLNHEPVVSVNSILPTEENTDQNQE